MTILAVLLRNGNIVSTFQNVGETNVSVMTTKLPAPASVLHIVSVMTTELPAPVSVLHIVSIMTTELPAPALVQHIVLHCAGALDKSQGQLHKHLEVFRMRRIMRQH